MEELLNAVTHALAESPDIAVWVLAIIYLYKTVIVGSVYSVIRFTVDKAHHAWVSPRTTRVDHTATLGELYCGSAADRLEALLRELIANRNADSPGWNFTHVHGTDIDYLRKLVEEDRSRGK